MQRLARVNHFRPRVVDAVLIPFNCDVLLDLVTGYSRHPLIEPTAPGKIRYLRHPKVLGLRFRARALQSEIAPTRQASDDEHTIGKPSYGPYTQSIPIATKTPGMRVSGLSQKTSQAEAHKWTLTRTYRLLTPENSMAADRSTSLKRSEATAKRATLFCYYSDPCLSDLVELLLPQFWPRQHFYSLDKGVRTAHSGPD